MQPTVRFHDIVDIKFGAINNRGHLFRAHMFNNWIFAYSKLNNQDLNEAISVENYLKQASDTYGIKYK